MPNNKKQRGREEKKKKIEAQKEAKKAVEEQQAQQKAEELRARLRGLFGTPAIDEVITDMARSSLCIIPSTATATAEASKMSSSFSSTTQSDGVMVCYHGSSADYFVPGSEYLQMVTSYVSLLKKFDDHVQLKVASDEFFCDTENQKIIFDDEFTIFVFALAVALYFNLPEKEKDVSFYVGLETWEEQKATAMHELRDVILMGLNIKYCYKFSTTQSKQERSDNRLKLLKKFREMGSTERGLITVLSSETKTNNDCDCMATKKRETNHMEKMQRCDGCREEFSNGLMKCKCNMAHYCSEACQIAHWPDHKVVCKEEKKYRRYGGNTSKNDDEKATKK